VTREEKLRAFKNELLGFKVGDVVTLYRACGPDTDPLCSRCPAEERTGVVTDVHGFRIGVRNSSGRCLFTSEELELVDD
jgi:hypothetical protein